MLLIGLFRAALIRFAQLNKLAAPLSASSAWRTRSGAGLNDRFGSCVTSADVSIGGAQLYGR